MTYDQLLKWACDHDLSSIHLDQLLKQIYKRFIPANHFENLPQKFVNVLSRSFQMTTPVVTHEKTSPDGTIKVLMKLEDGLFIETVLLQSYKKWTLCLSSQVGCAMKCRFCHTATQGPGRDLKDYEIVGQYLVAAQLIANRNESKINPPSIVFMGQGEPLANAQHVAKACHILVHKKTSYLGPRQITLSTVGLLPQIHKLHDFPPINLALSLHSPFSQVRQELIPMDKHFPFPAVLDELFSLPYLKRQYLMIEYLMIAGMTDRYEDALELGKIFNAKKVIINLIAYNPIPSRPLWIAPQKEDVERFKKWLVDQKLKVMIRTTKGQDIMAACGQLKSDVETILHLKENTNSQA